MKYINKSIFSIIPLLLLLTPLAASAQIMIPPPTPCFVDPSQPHCIEPIVLIPGLTASFNIKTLFRDQPSDNWRFVPFGNIYKGLIEKLEDAGYEQGEKLFIAHYDWRQSNAQSAAEYLAPIIEEAKQVSGIDEIDIVAHSMGGLVAREYIQGTTYNNDVDQLIMLGTPNEGSSDAYVAWEGGIFPNGWDPIIRWYISAIEYSLNNRYDQDLEPPLSFRAFFPSLKDLLPTTDFVALNGSPVAIDDLAEQNNFLQQLNGSVSTLTQRVLTRTIAGNNYQTLNAVTLNNNRSPEDIQLERWRDGHANPDPPEADTAAGDKTVLLSSAHIGSHNMTIDNTDHTNLPEEAQEEILDVLGQDPSGPHFAYNKPESILGTVVLSPINPVITGPNGETLSQDENTFSEAEYVDDPDDPNGPKLLVIADPPDGDYEVTLTGTDTGDYTVITTYADEDETQSTTQDGTTTVGQTNIYTFTIENETFIPDLDLVALTKQLKDTIKQLHKDKHIKHHGKLKGRASKLHNHAKKYIKALQKHGPDDKKTQKEYEKLLKDFAKFSETFYKEINKGHLDEVAVQQLLLLHNQIEASL